MTSRGLIIASLLLLAGCATRSAHDAAAESRGYERGYRQAVKEQYWLIQNQQRRPASPPAAKPVTP